MRLLIKSELVWQLIEFAELNGFNSKSLLHSIGETTLLAERSKGKIDAGKFLHVLDKMIFRLKNPYVGLQFGKYLQLYAMNATCETIRRKMDMREGLQAICDSTNDMGNGWELSWREKKKDLHFYIKMSKHLALINEESSRNTMLFLLVNTLARVSTLLLDRINPLKISIPYSVVAPEKHIEALGSFARFNQKNYGVDYLRSILNQTIVYEDLLLFQKLINSIRECHFGHSNKIWTKRTSQLLLNQIHPRFPTIERISFMLHVSVRTLQRKLKEEGTTYIKIVDSVRRALTIILMQKEIQDIDIAFLLGYSDLSSFLYARKRWSRQPTSKV